MPETDRPLFARLQEDLSQFGDEVGEMARLRWELAQLELRTAAAQTKRLAIVLACAAVMALTGLPVLAVSLAELLDGIGLSRLGWLAVFGGGLLLGAAAWAYLAWRAFRRKFVGLEETVEELREDLVWLREWK